MSKNYSLMSLLDAEKNSIQEDGQNIDNLRSTIIDNVSNELRTPLNIMLGYASLLHDGALGTLSPEQHHAMSAIVNRADEMRDLVERINILMEAEAGKGHLSKLTLEEAAQKIIKSKQQAANEAGIRLTYKNMPEMAKIVVNENQLQQAIACLLDNAVQYTPKGGRIEVNIHADPNWAYLEVADTGIGIDKKNLEQITAFFSQENEIKSTRNNMLGLGLSIVRSVIARHTGQIDIESEFGKGSRFTIKLPIGPAIEEELLDKATSSKKHILIVDDDENIVLTLQKILQKGNDYEISTATSSEEALKLFAYHPFDLVLSDYKMPKLNGIELTKAIRALKPTTEVIWITAHGDRALQKEAEELNVQRCLTKPIALSKIRETVQEALTSEEQE
ncbi:MAG: hybrid sensor histidine kinase/response regulator [Chloroflexota bacterium]